MSALTGLSRDVTVTATVTLSNPAAWEVTSTAGGIPYVFDWDCPLSGSITLGEVSIGWTVVNVTGGGFPAAHSLRLRFTDATLTTVDIEIGTGTGTLTDVDGNSMNEVVYEYTYNSPASASVTFEVGPLYEWAHRITDSSRIPHGTNGPSSPCHAQHLLEERWWESADDTTFVITVGTTPLTQSFSWDSALLPALDAAVGSSAGGTASTGTMQTLEIIGYDAIYDADALEFSATYASSPVTITASGNSLTWATAGGNFGATTLEVTRGADKWGTFDLKGYDFATLSDVEFTLPDPSTSGTMDVASAYSQVLVYKTGSRSDWSGRNYPTHIAPTVATTWAASEDEVTDPTDYQCELERAGIDGDPSDSYDCGVLQVRRMPEDPVHLPSGVASPPSAWVASGSNFSQAAGSGGSVTFTAGIGCTAGSATRTCYDVYESFWLSTASGCGWDVLGPPFLYEFLRHLTDAEATAYGLTGGTGTDVTNWAQYRYLRLTYASTAAQTLAVQVVNRTYTIDDPHVTGASRRDDFAYTTADETIDLGTVSFIDSGGVSGQVAYIDLQADADHILQHIQSVTLSGFVHDGGATEVELVLEGVDLVPYDPVAHTETGQLLLKSAMRRVDPDTELPLDYTGANGTAEGGRCLIVPDEVEDLTSEPGLKSVEELRGASTGEILDYMVGLPGLQLSWQEGIEVSGAGDATPPWEDGSTAFDAAFKDSDGGYMLTELYFGDLAEQYPLTIGTSASTYTAVPVRPRVGRLAWNAGRMHKIIVRKHLHGSLHGMVRDTTDAPAGAGVGVILWEGTNASPVTDITSIQEVETDAWSYARFTKGFREVRLGCLAPSDSGAPDDDPVGWSQARNRGRGWPGDLVWTGSGGVTGQYGGDNIVPMRAGAELLVRTLPDGDNYAVNLFRRASYRRPWVLIGAVGDADAAPQRPLSAGPNWRHMVRQADSVERYSADLGDTYTDATGTELDVIIRHVYNRTDLLAWGTGKTSFSPLGVALTGAGDLVAYPLDETPVTIVGGVGATAQVLIDQELTGRYHVMIWDGSSYKQYRSNDQIGADWTILRSDAVTTGSGAGYMVHWRGRSGLCGTAGYNADDDAVYVWSRTSVGAAWSLPAQVADGVLIDVVPYLYERPDGRWECGWRYGSVWHIYVSGDLTSWSAA